MRLLPILTSLIVAIVLYGLIMEREALRAFATGNDTVAEAVEENAVREINPPVAVVAKTSQAQNVSSGVVLSGRTEAARNVEVRAETTGLVISEPLRKGTSITAGDLLCHLDPGTRNAELAEANARLREAEVNDRATSQLAERGFAAETAAVGRRAALETAQAAVQRAETELSRIEIRAPFDGILETDTAELGALLQPGGPCATLISLDPIKLVGYVPEQGIGKLTLGSPASARLITDTEVSGKVTFLSRSADPLTRTFRVEVEVANTDLSIRDGLTVKIFIALDGEKAHLLPQSVLTLNDEGLLGIRAAVDGIARFMPVTVIRDTPEGLWLAGLPETVDVIVVGQDFVRDGRDIIVSYSDTNQ